MALQYWPVSHGGCPVPHVAPLPPLGAHLPEAQERPSVHGFWAVHASPNLAGCRQVPQLLVAALHCALLHWLLLAHVAPSARVPGWGRQAAGPPAAK